MATGGFDGALSVPRLEGGASFRRLARELERGEVGVLAAMSPALVREACPVVALEEAARVSRAAGMQRPVAWPEMLLTPPISEGR